MTAYGQVGRYEVPPSKAMAGWALGLAIIPCLFPIPTLVAVGLAIAVLVRSRDGRRHGKGMAIAALIIAALWMAGFVVLILSGALGTLQPDADRDDSGQVTGESQVSSLKIREGDCVNDPTMAGFDADSEDEEVSMTVTVLPCEEPHDFETYLVYDLPDGDYPGEDEVGDAAATRCLREFKGFVGIAYSKSELEPYVLYPTSRTWRFLDDRSVTCLVGRPGTKTSGSLAGSKV